VGDVTGRPARDGLFEIARTEIDGVPVFWSPVDGPRVATLMFRVGRANEPAAMGGISHLVEHLALAPLTQQNYVHNGSVVGRRTFFQASGTDAELGDFLGRVTDTLSELPVDRLLMERRILRLEAQGQPPNLVGAALWMRFGYAGHGLTTSDEPCLAWVGPDAVRDWARSMFTRDNATLWLSGPPPPGLRLSLGSGPASADVRLESLPDLVLPAYGGPGRGVVLTWLADRSPAAVVGLAVAARRARGVLRFERGLVYDVQTNYEPLDGTVAHAFLYADCQSDQAEAVVAELLRAVVDIAEHGPTDAEIAREVNALMSQLGTPQASLGMLDGAAYGCLLGRPLEQPATLVDEYASLTPPAIATSLRASLDGLLLLAPADPPAGPAIPWHRYPDWSASRVTGRVFRPAGLPVLNRRRDRLTIGPEGVTWSNGLGGQLTVCWDACVAAIHEGDGRRELRGADGFRVFVVAAEWQAGHEAIAAVDTHVPVGRVACGEHGIGGLEDPADAAPWQTS
jgi:hypothetical protein